MKKSLFLLASFGAAACLIGGTFATFAVTDNADPFGVKITPQTLDIDDTAVLEWGTKGLVNVDGLKAGDEKGPYVVGLKATTSKGGDYTGLFKLKLVDQSGKTGTTPKLINYLHVLAFEGNQTGKTLADLEGEGKHALTYVPTDEAVYETSVSVTVHSGAEYPLSIYVTLDSSALTVYDDIFEDVVYMEVDWNKAAGDSEYTGTQLFFKKPAGWANAYFYAFGANGQTAAFPGQAMVETATDGIFTATVDTSKFDKIIFNDGAAVETTNKTEDLDIPTAISASNNCYVMGTGWTAIPEDPTEETVWCAVSADWGNWDATAAGAKPFKLNKGSVAEEYVLSNVELALDYEFKVRKADNSAWAWDGGNYKVQVAGTYDIYFRPEFNSEWGGFIYLAPVTE